MYFFQLFYTCLSNLDLRQGLDLCYYVLLVWREYTKAFFFPACVFSLVLFVFTTFLFFLCFFFLFFPCCFCFVLVFCSCLHCFRYFFPPVDSPQAGSRWSSYAQLLPPPPPPPLVEHSWDADTANLQYPHPRRRYLNPLPENEGV